MRLIKQAYRSLLIPADIDKKTQDDALKTTIDALKTTIDALKTTIDALQGLKPADELEGMLATQMLATHSAAMECLRRAMVPEQTILSRDMNLKHAAKMLGVYSR